MDQGSLQSNLDLEDNIYLYCLSCDYKNNIGLEVYAKMEKMVNNEI
jgi:hypothetical protein